jgi:hypothetical protein
MYGKIYLKTQTEITLLRYFVIWRFIFSQGASECVLFNPSKKSPWIKKNIEGK